MIEPIAHDEPTTVEMRRVAHYLAKIGYHAAAGQLHRRAWQREQVDLAARRLARAQVRQGAADE